ncbi:LysR family transcriptional regulator [Pelagibius sp. Alg239-R121]|uniref:LysR family transcriptional regulator n=1 Tax=Pelagibius sp. Alg239-R121 TaxID=2993448 RepID=UPI0024A65394|nr:LysR family transcriptional regulator [Pelagibius sp. Alg239-R121]
MPFKNEIVDWDDLRLFLAVAQAGGLAGATSVTQASAPTLSRRMTHLERAFGTALFDRHQSGYDLTSAGRELLDQVRNMDLQAQSINAWRQQIDPRPVVKITAGVWTSVFIARHLNRITRGATAPRIELLTGANFLNLSRREADLGIRNQKPEQQGLARRRIGPVKFAIYGQKDYVDANPHAGDDTRFAACDWVVPSVAGTTGSSTLWLSQRLITPANLTCGTPQTVLEAAGEGAGLCVLPCFIGGADPRLTRCSDFIEELTHTQWLVSHNENRTLPHIRQVSRALYALFTKEKALFAGG